MNCTVCGQVHPCSAMREIGEPAVWREQRLCRNCGKPEHFGSAYCKPDESPPTPSEKEQHNGK